MSLFDAIKCHICATHPQDFVMLSCNHIICAQCLSVFESPQQSILSVPCPCGITSNILRQLQSRESASTCLLSQKSLPTLKPSKAQNQILDQAQFAVLNRSDWNSIHSQTKLGKRDKINCKSPNFYLANQLANQLKFMELRYKRHINQINRYFSFLIAQLNKKYQETQKSLYMDCSNLIQNSQIKSLSQIEMHIQKAYKPKVEKHLMKISKEISSALKSLKSAVDLNYMEVQKQNYNSSNLCQSKRDRSENAKVSSSHHFCKRQQQIHTYLSKMKSNTQKLNKLGKKKHKNSKQCYY